MAYDWNYEIMSDGNANCTFWFRHDITWHDGVPFTVDDVSYTINVQKAYGDSWGHADFSHVVAFQKLDDWACSIQFDCPSIYALYMCLYDIVPEHIYQYIAIPADAAGGGSTTGHHGEWPGADALPAEILAPLTYPVAPEDVWVGTNMWKYIPGTYVSGTGGGLTCEAFSGFWTKLTRGDIDFKYYWQPGAPPKGGSYNIGLSDLVLLANAYGTTGKCVPVPFKLGGLHTWEPGCDLAAPAGVVGLSDLVTLALNYGKTWGQNP
jgi:hypothetical protein